jgi:hypothetical protein
MTEIPSSGWDVLDEAHQCLGRGGGHRREVAALVRGYVCSRRPAWTV